LQRNAGREALRVASKDLHRLSEKKTRKMSSCNHFPCFHAQVVRTLPS
jgi:hypothetical protein